MRMRNISGRLNNYFIFFWEDEWRELFVFFFRCCGLIVASGMVGVDERRFGFSKGLRAVPLSSTIY